MLQPFTIMGLLLYCGINFPWNIVLKFKMYVLTTLASLACMANNIQGLPLLLVPGNAGFEKKKNFSFPKFANLDFKKFMFS